MILSHPSVNIQTLPRALKIYDTIRRPFSQDIQRRSELTGTLYHLIAMGWEGVSAEESAAGQYPQELLSALDRKMLEAQMWVGQGDFVRVREKVSRPRAVFLLTSGKREYRVTKLDMTLVLSLDKTAMDFRT